MTVGARLSRNELISMTGLLCAIPTLAESVDGVEKLPIGDQQELDIYLIRLLSLRGERAHC